VTGIQQLVSLNDQIKLYPNPTHDFIFIENNSDLKGKTVCSVFDLTGRVLVDAIDLTKTSSTLDLSALKAGVYLIRFNHNQQTTCVHVVKL
jgi:hypothetical protein